MNIFGTQRRKLWTVAILGGVSCVAGIAYAIFCGTANDGGRGGAVAVALAFAALFTSSPALETLIEAPDETGEPTFDNIDPDKQIQRLRSAIAVLEDDQRSANRFLVFTSVLGTLVWAFGDVLAAWLGAAP